MHFFPWKLYAVDLWFRYRYVWPTLPVCHGLSVISASFPCVSCSILAVLQKGAKKEEIKNPQTSLIIDECQNLINVCWAIYELHPGAGLNPDWVWITIKTNLIDMWANLIDTWWLQCLNFSKMEKQKTAVLVQMVEMLAEPTLEVLNAIFTHNTQRWVLSNNFSLPQHSESFQDGTLFKSMHCFH